MIQSQTRKINLQIVYFTLIRTVVNTSYRMVYPLMPLFATGLGVSLEQLAAGFSVRSFLGILAPFLAAFADTRGRKAGMLLGTGLFTLGTGLVAALPGFVTFIIGSSLVVIGNGVFIPSMQAYLSDRIPFERRGTVLSITELSWALAFIVGVPIVSAVMLKTSWVAPFIGLAGLGLILSIVLLKWIPRDEPSAAPDQAMLLNLKKVLTYWPAVAGLLMGILFTGANETVNLVFSDWIKQAFGLTFATMTAASVVIGTSEMTSELLSVLTLDRLGKKRAILIALALNSMAAVLLPLTSKNLTLALIGLGSFYITFEFALISGMTLMSEVMPQTRATLMAATVASFSLGRLLGSLIAPGLYRIDFWAACLMAVALNGLSLLFLKGVKINTDAK
jgi:predicted MFS family arabinose efflux permease